MYIYGIIYSSFNLLKQPEVQLANFFSFHCSYHEIVRCHCLS
uniref:Uncharacterized protein n=1 Tax=Anguilla anguilla TaxID=7936 RepID=A0A0E9UKL8_ANGAN